MAGKNLKASFGKSGAAPPLDVKREGSRFLIKIFNDAPLCSLPRLRALFLEIWEFLTGVFVLEQKIKRLEA